MDQGLTKAVERFVEQVGAAYRTAAEGTTIGTDKIAQDATVEAFNLCGAFIDVDGRHTDTELWALAAAFSMHDLFPGATTPDAIRRNGLVDGKRTWLSKPSDLFETLRQVDSTRGTKLARVYYDEAMALAHLVVSALDDYASPDELKAIVDLQRLLLTALPTGQPQAAATGPSPASTDDTAEGAPAMEELPPPEPVEDLLAELDALIGLDAVKEEVRLLSALLRVQRLREERELPVVDKTKHLIFSGNPGTGKTTVARLLARIYRSLEVVERGHLVEVDRSGLVAGFVGQTATRVTEVFDRADGGVLLIDEAYSLTRGGERDFGREAIDAVVKNVEDRRDSMVVILAGYPKEMADLVATNPGFQSRFPKTILFPDYANTELVAILELIADKGRYHLTDNAREAAEAWFGSHTRGRGFGNGRLARNLFEAAVSRHATRLVDVEEPTDEQLTTLEAIDIAAVPVAEAPDGGSDGGGDGDSEADDGDDLAAFGALLDEIANGKSDGDDAGADDADPDDARADDADGDDAGADDAEGAERP